MLTIAESVIDFRLFVDQILVLLAVVVVVATALLLVVVVVVVVMVVVAVVTTKVIIHFFIYLYAKLNSRWQVTESTRIQTTTAMKQI
jgi:heme/copper-type cytochrome/quinol oxidase subunit 4